MIITREHVEALKAVRSEVVVRKCDIIDALHKSDLYADMRYLLIRHIRKGYTRGIFAQEVDLTHEQRLLWLDYAIASAEKELSE